MVAYDTDTLRGDSNVCPEHNFYHINVYDLTNAHAHISTHTGPFSPVDNKSDCRSKGHKLDPGLVPYFCRD